MNPKVSENSYMSAYRKQVIKRQSVNICSFCVVSVAPFSTSFLLIDVYMYFHILAFFLFHKGI